MSSAYDKAVKLLKIRPHHSEELTKKLQMRGFDRAEIDAVVTKLQEEGAIDNSQFAEMYLDELLRNKSFGFYMLKAKLMQRGIKSSEAETLLKERFSVKDERSMALRVVDREKNTDRMNLAQKLQRKGFRSEVIRQVIN
ncbi:MAG: RecX family transcriptional regulator [Candidatus Doudnabacteria bacterium]|nr:RecX family transcriptional regulator [Candidatus Doudnabacteria bacterium]